MKVIFVECDACHRRQEDTTEREVGLAAKGEATTRAFEGWTRVPDRAVSRMVDGRLAYQRGGDYCSTKCLADGLAKLGNWL